MLLPLPMVGCGRYVGTGLTSVLDANGSRVSRTSAERAAGLLGRV